MPPSMRRLLAVVAVAPVALLTVPASAADGDWPMVGRDAAHTATTDAPAPPYRVAWSSDAPEAPVAGPVVAGGKVLAVGAVSVAALDASTGEPLWESERIAGPAGPPAVAGDVFVHSSGTGSSAALVARSLEDGREVWRVFTGDAVPGGPAVVDGRIFVGTRAGSVLAIDAETGETEWEAEVEGRVDAAPAATEDVVVFVAEDRETFVATAVALEASSGEERWRFSPGAGSLGSSSPSLSEGVVYLGMGDGNIHALDLESGAERWSVPSLAGRAGFRARHVPAVPGDVLVPDVRVVHLLDEASGEERWTYQLSGLLKSTSPASVGDWVVFGDEDGEVAAVDVASGRLVWREDLGDGSVGSPAADGDRVYLVVQGEDGIVVALEHDPDGEVLDVPSPTALFPTTALLNFAAAAALVGAVTLLLFRYLVRDPADRREEGS